MDRASTKTHDKTDEGAHRRADKPDSPSDLTKPSWTYVLRKTVREFGHDQCTDLAAALTYYAVLAMFPAALAMLSVVGLVSDGRETVTTLLDILRQVGAGGVAETIEPTLVELSQSSGAGLGLVLGIAAALWSASGYTGAFGRGMNRIYEIDEGRPIWKLRPMMLLVTLVTIVLAAAVAVLVMSYHWFTDVVAGTCAGLLLLAVVRCAWGTSLGMRVTRLASW